VGLDEFASQCVKLARRPAPPLGGHALNLSGAHFSSVPPMQYWLGGVQEQTREQQFKFHLVPEPDIVAWVIVEQL